MPVHTEPMLAVENVPFASRWYQQLLGLKSNHGGPDFDQLVDETGASVLLLHRWNDPEHPSMLSRMPGYVGHGVLIYFRVADAAAVVATAKQMRAEILQDFGHNPITHQKECQIRDPDGYYITICGK